MNTNKVTIIGSLVVVLLLIAIPTVIKVINNHNDILYRVVEDKIIEKAKECYYKMECTENEITLASLYELGYLEKMSDPVTKEYYNDKSYVKVEENKFVFVVVE